MNASPVARAARDAVSALNKRGWLQGKYTDEHSSALCVLSALRVATGYYVDGLQPDEHSEGVSLYNEVVYALDRHVGEVVADWNDAPGRTFSEVKAALLAVAAISDATATATDPGPGGETPDSAARPGRTPRGRP